MIQSKPMKRHSEFIYSVLILVIKSTLAHLAPSGRPYCPRSPVAWINRGLSAILIHICVPWFGPSSLLFTPGLRSLQQKSHLSSTTNSGRCTSTTIPAFVFSTECPGSDWTLGAAQRSSALSGNYHEGLLATWTTGTMDFLDFICAVRC